MATAHLCQAKFMGMPGGMRELYDRLELLPTSTNADVVLIRSHVAYWSGNTTAERVEIAPSRGHSYRVKDPRSRNSTVVRIANHYDHRDGVTGWM